MNRLGLRLRIVRFLLPGSALTLSAPRTAFDRAASAESGRVWVLDETFQRSWARRWGPSAFDASSAWRSLKSTPGTFSVRFVFVACCRTNSLLPERRWDRRVEPEIVLLNIFCGVHIAVHVGGCTAVLVQRPAHEQRYAQPEHQDDRQPNSRVAFHFRPLFTRGYRFFGSAGPGVLKNLSDMPKDRFAKFILIVCIVKRPKRETETKARKSARQCMGR